jgi:hypothetical protein
MKLDAAGERFAKCRRGGDPNADTQRRVGTARVLGARHPANVVLAAREEERVGRDRRTVREPCARPIDLPHGDATFDRRTQPFGFVQHYRIETMTRNRDRRMGQGGLRAAIARKDAGTRHAIGVEHVGIDPEPGQRLQRPPAQESAADRITGFARSLDEQMR